METIASLIQLVCNPFVLTVLVIYFVPTIFAFHNNSAAWATCLGVNILFGWTFIGWIVAMILAYRPSKEQIAYQRRVKKARDEFYLREASKSNS